VRAVDLPALEYLAAAGQQKGEREYWLVDGIRCYGSVLIRFQPKGRKAAISTHIDLTSNHLSTEPVLIKLAVRKAWKLGINPVRIVCNATDYERREHIERSGGEFVDAVRERIPTHSGKVRVYSFSASLRTLSLQGVLRDTSELGKDLSRRPESQPLAGPAVEPIGKLVDLLLGDMPE
jgi:hypothetical protein